MNNSYNPFMKFNEFSGSIDARRIPFSKSFDFTPWGGLEGFLEASKSGQTGYNNKGSQYRIFVPDVLRAGDMTAVAISSLPFDIMRGEEVVDSSSEWKNKIGGMPKPQRLIYNVALSLCGGAAYVIPEGTDNITANLKYVPPGTITYTFDQGGISQYYYNSQFGGNETFTPDKLIHFFLPDSDVEDQPARAHPFGAAMSAAWRSMAMGNTINVQSERGFIPPTLLMAEGLIETERKKAEEWYNLWIKGAFKVIAKIINAKTLTVQKVGSGMDELKAVFVELKRDASEEIGKAFGIPAALFMSDKAYAAEYDALIRQWYSASIFVTIYQTIAETFTEQYFSKKDCSMIFRPETLDAFQEDETKKAQSFKTYVDAGVRPSIAAQMLGIEMPEGIDYKELDEEFDKPEPEPVIAGGTANPAESQPKPEQAPMRAVVLSPDEMGDLATWFEKAKAWHKKGKSAADWENKNLREEIAAPVRAKLATAKTMDDIQAAFQIGEESEEKNTEIIALAEAINKAIELEAHKPNIIINQPQGRKSKLTEYFVNTAFGEE